MHTSYRALNHCQLVLAICLLSGVSACGTTRAIPLPAEPCSSLAEPILGRKTVHAVLPSTGDAAQDWQLYGVAETGQLNIANNDKADGFAIIKKCEERDRRAYAKITAPWWAFWR